MSGFKQSLDLWTQVGNWDTIFQVVVLGIALKKNMIPAFFMVVLTEMRHCWIMCVSQEWWQGAVLEKAIEQKFAKSTPPPPRPHDTIPSSVVESTP